MKMSKKEKPLDLLGSITKVTTNKYNKVVIETSLGKRYYSDLTFFQNIHCYPTNDEWNNVSIDRNGEGLIWSSKFQVKINQVIEQAYQTETLFGQKHS
jgi:hypothetical protein